MTVFVAALSAIVLALVLALLLLLLRRNLVLVLVLVLVRLPCVVQLWLCWCWCCFCRGISRHAACTVVVATRSDGAKLALVAGALGENRGMRTARRACRDRRRLL